MTYMIIIETIIFTRRITELIDDDSYKDLQLFLCGMPESGKIIKGTKGLRKVRWSTQSKGKSGGLRVIYYYYKNNETICMLFAYPKSEQDSLSGRQVEILNKLLEEFEL